MNLRESYLRSLQNFYSSKAQGCFVSVKGKEFDGNENLFPASRVFIKNRKIHIDDFMMCDHPVTQDEFKAIFPEGYKPKFASNVAKGEIQGNRPADSISWYAAIAYCNKRSVQEGLTPCYTIPGVTDAEGFLWDNFAYSSIPTRSNNAVWDGTVYNPSADGYRLPTEIEWEYAARGGVFLESFKYSGSNNIDEVAWYSENSSRKTHEVKKKAPNRLGLYDMSGNINEWCWDFYVDINTNISGIGNASRFFHVLRGGVYNCPDFYCTVADKGCCSSYQRHYLLGFRVVRSCSN